mgnify:CR=1 FL=1
MLRSTCGEHCGDSDYEFNSPWSVASLFDQTLPHVLVADTNNQRIQCFSNEYDYQFRFRYTLMMKQKPYYLATSKRHFAISCEKGLIYTFLAKDRTLLATVDFNKICSRKSK